MSERYVVTPSRAELQESLARRFATDADAYSNGKSEFIREVQRRAVAWRHTAVKRNYEA